MCTFTMHLEQCIHQRIFKAFKFAFISQTFSKSFDDFYAFKASLYIYTVLYTQFHSSLPTLYKSKDLILLRFHSKSHLPSSPYPYHLFDEDINHTFKPEPMRSGS